MTRVIAVGITLLVLFGAIAGYIFFFNTKPVAATCIDMETKPKIVAFGDSLVAGYGATQGNDFVSLLSASTGVQIANLGRNGDTTATAFDRIQSVIDAEPDVVLVLVGGNDALSRVPVATTQRNLESILSQLTQRNIRVVLVGVLGGFPSDPYKPMFEALSKQYGTGYVPNILSGLIGNTQFMSDQIHPNDAGYARVAAKILPALNEACSATPSS